jgi:hypothetical protein
MDRLRPVHLTGGTAVLIPSPSVADVIDKRGPRMTLIVLSLLAIAAVTAVLVRRR